MSPGPGSRAASTGGRGGPGLWVDVALRLALVVLACLFLNAGLMWLLVQEVQLSVRLDSCQSVGQALAATIAQAVPHDGLERATGSVLGRFRADRTGIEEIYVVDPSVRPVAAPIGDPPRAMDAGLREALLGRERHVSVERSLLPFSSFTGAGGGPVVVVTEPIVSSGAVVGALRIRWPIQGQTFLESPVGFLLAYTLFTGLLIWIAGYLLLRRKLVEPVRAVLEGTRRIADGDFTYRVEVRAAREVQDLVQALNEMARSLAAYRESTTDQVHRLEEANKALARAQDQVIQAARLAGVGRLAAGIAHEVGNPLAAVVGFVDILRNNPEDTALVRDLLERVQKETTRIHGILRELLDVARPGPGVVVDCSVEDILREAVELMRHQPSFRGLDVTLRCASAVPRVRVDPEKLHQVLVNLLINAADAAGEGGHIHVLVECKEPPQAGEGGMVRVVVSDDGPGFPQEVLSRVFEPFVTTKEPGRGIGLGLATSLAIVQRFGGSISVGNQAGGGACVTVELPWAPDRASLGCDERELA